MSAIVPIQSAREQMTVDVAIVGGGIGGLAAAIALREAGIDAHVYERAPVLREVGGQLLVREPSARLLETWGLGAFYDNAVPVDVAELRDGRSAALIRASSADFADEGACYSTHRVDLHDLLGSALPPECVHLGRGVAEVTSDEAMGSATVRFTDRTAVTARMVIGADGIRSVVRKVVCDDEPIFQGLVVVRTLRPASALPASLTNDRIRMWVDGPRMILTAPMRAGTQVAIDAILDSAAGELASDDPWETEVPIASLLERYDDFHPSLLSLILAGDAPARANPVYDRDPIETWSSGRIVLVGDAAHPMAPRQGQGANQAIQDAGALAGELAVSGLENPAEAIANYERRRVPRATALQRASRRVAEEFDVSAAQASHQLDQAG